MSNKKEISTRHYVCILKDGSRFFLEDEDAERLRLAIRSGSQFLEIEDSLVASSEFSRLISSENYQETEKIRRGEWKCRFGFWHHRGEECGHQYCSEKDLERLKIMEN